jgi:hypothetical protein
VFKHGSLLSENYRLPRVTSQQQSTVYADAATTQPAFAHMEAYLRSLRQQVRRILTEHGIGETKVIREKVEEFAISAYGEGL